MTTKEEKSTFGANKPEVKHKPKDREELAVGWKRVDKNGDEYVSVKLKIDKHKELNFKMFKNKRKKDGDAKPDYVAFTDTQKVEVPTPKNSK